MLESDEDLQASQRMQIDALMRDAIECDRALQNAPRGRAETFRR